MAKKFLAIGSRLDEKEIKKICIFFNEPSFILSCNINSQNSIFWCSENSCAVHVVSLHDLKVRALWAVSTCKITWPI
jgi:hypothetical protein